MRTTAAPGAAPGASGAGTDPGDAAPPRAGGVLAVVARTAEVLAHPLLHPGLLAPWERDRLAGIRSPDRREDVLAARLLVRLCTAGHTGLPLEAVAPAQRCPGCGRAGHGRPYLPGRPDLGLSYSHADGLVAAAVGPGAVGIDVEPSTRRPGPLRQLRRLVPAPELREALDGPDPGPALLALWVRREARIKAGRADLPVRVWSDPERSATAAVAALPAVTPSVRALSGLHAPVPAGPRQPG
ncbi:4'-phosphopantetheinyl transferase superfamily protein [Streptomyces sp. NPDC097619]|uniref:4'-phosphopantetheinyl transferase family protein n=1 Tax=Streptomyces sp. NPDC097619 TaxID=3157228 RepID=UPI003334058D